MEGNQGIAGGINFPRTAQAGQIALRSRAHRDLKVVDRDRLHRHVADADTS